MAAAFYNLSQLLRAVHGIGTPKQWIAAGRGAVVRLCALLWSILAEPTGLRRNKSQIPALTSDSSQTFSFSIPFGDSRKLGLFNSLLDPNDNQKLDDSWDNGPYAGRFAFRIHVGTSTQTQGCIVGSASDLSQIAADLTYSPSEGKTYINQKASPYRKDINDPEIFHEFFIGTLTVSE